MILSCFDYLSSGSESRPRHLQVADRPTFAWPVDELRVHPCLAWENHANKPGTRVGRRSPYVDVSYCLNLNVCFRAAETTNSLFNSREHTSISIALLKLRRVRISMIRMKISNVWRVDTVSYAVRVSGNSGNNKFRCGLMNISPRKDGYLLKVTTCTSEWYVKNTCLNTHHTRF